MEPRFDRMRVHHYGVFRDPSEIAFSSHRTVIVGPGGSGKTTLARALAKLGPLPDVGGWRSRAPAAPTSVRVDVATDGDREAIRQYPGLVLLSGETMHEFPERARALAGESDTDVTWRDAAQAAHANYDRIIRGCPWRHGRYTGDLFAAPMAAGERVVLGFALAIALRSILKCEAPVVLESPSGLLDTGLANGLLKFFDAQACQQVLICDPLEASLAGLAPDYEIAHDGEASRVVRR